MKSFGLLLIVVLVSCGCSKSIETPIKTGTSDLSKAPAANEQVRDITITNSLAKADEVRIINEVFGIHDDKFMLDGVETQISSDNFGFTIQKVVSGAFTSEGRKEKLVILQLDGLSGADLTYRHKYVIYSDDLKTKVSEIITRDDYVQTEIYKGEKKLYVLFCKHHSTSGGGEEHYNTIEFELLSWNEYGRSNNEGIYEYSFTSKSDDTPAIQKMHNPVIDKNGFTINGYTFAWNRNKESFEKVKQ